MTDTGTFTWGAGHTNNIGWAKGLVIDETSTRVFAGGYFGKDTTTYNFNRVAAIQSFVYTTGAISWS
jgi:hypothetical protein